MAFLGQAFDPNTVPPAQDFAPLPSGEYPAIIMDSAMKPTKANDGQYLELTFQVIDGPMKGRLAWSRLNLDNKNAQAVEIAQRDLSAICAAAGITQAITDSQALHNRPMVIRIEFIAAGTKRKNGTVVEKDGNEIKAYKRIEGAQPSPFQQQPGAQATAANAPSGQPPGWYKPAA